MSYATPKSRYLFLDVFRGVVVLLMLEGHFVRLVLLPELQKGTVFLAHEIFHGVTAPAFIFGAGFTFAIASERKGALLQRLNTAVLRRVWRAVLLILIGYGLHLPFYSLTKTLSEATPEQWSAFLQFDVLQLIGFSILFLRVATLFIHREDRLLLVTTSISLAIVLTTPLVWSAPFIRALPPFFGMMFTGSNGSLFPLFPYAAFLTAGVATSWGFLRAARDRRERQFMRRLLFAGLSIIPAGIVLDLLPFRVYRQVDFWYTAPSYFLIRLGLLFVLLPLFWYPLRGRLQRGVEDPGSVKPPGMMLKWVARLGIESLFVYIAHLLLLYGSVINAGVNVRGLFGSSLGLVSSIAWCGGFVLLLSLATYGWNYLKTHHPHFMRVAFWWIGFMWVGEFLVRPW